ncbi:MAG: MMPL family transporter [Pseudomonadales bacterium]|nr:MMPL family transporter [Pseudomonadales bacterium]
MVAKTCFEAIVNRPWHVIALTLALTIIAGWGAQSLELKTDYRKFFSEDSEYLQAYEKLQDTYSSSDNVLFVIDPADNDVFSQESLELLLTLTDLSWKLPFSVRVDSLTNFQHTEADEDGLVVRDLVDNELDLTPEYRAEIKAIAIAEDVLRNKLLSENADVAAINVSFRIPHLENYEEKEIALASRALAAEIRQQFPGSEIYITGMIMGNHASMEVIEEESNSLIPLMFFIIIAFLFLLFRSIKATAAILAIIIASLVSTMGIAGWIGFEITSIVASAPIIILTMAIADCVHILVTFNHNMRAGLSKVDSLVESLTLNLSPVFLTSLTTAIGFLTMNYSDSPPFQTLGNVVAIGVIMAFVLSLTLLPAMLVIIIKKPKATHVDQQPHWITPFANAILKFRNPIFWGTGAITCVLVACISQNEINDQFDKYYDESREFRYSSDFANEHLSGLYNIEYSLESPYEGGIYNPKFLQDIEKFTLWLKEQPEVLQVNSITDVFKRLNKNMHGDDDSWYKLPVEQDLAAQYFLLYELSLPFGLDVTNLVDFNKTSTRVFITLEEQTTKQTLKTEDKFSQWLNSNLPKTSYYQGSMVVMFSHMGMDNAESMVKATTIALILISIIITLSLGSIRIGMVSFISNLMPAALAFGVWGIFYQQVGISVAMAIGMTLGIVVDNSVHFLSKYLHARKEKNLAPEAAIHYAFSHVGIALLICNFVLIAGFYVLSFSVFKLNVDMGLFTAITLSLALAVNLIFLPTLLLRIDKGDPLNDKTNNNHSPADALEINTSTTKAA